MKTILLPVVLTLFTVQIFGQDENPNIHSKHFPTGKEDSHEIQAAGDKFIIKDDENNNLMGVADEGSGGSIWLPSLTDSILNKTNKIYNINGTLYFNGTAIYGGVIGGWYDDGSVVRLNSSTDKVGIGTNLPSTALDVLSDEGVLFEGTYGSGTTLNPGSGSRMHWYPKKAAFRAGIATTQWDDANIGGFSAAFNYHTIASGTYAFATGYDTEASGQRSTAMGSSTRAAGLHSTALGSLTEATANYSTSIGRSSLADGQYSIAIGTSVEASGDNSIALGNFIDTEGNGSFCFGDNSTSTILSMFGDNRFNSRFAGGYYFYTNSTATVGAFLGVGANSWNIMSDSTKKERFLPVDGEKILTKIKNFNLRTWNYKGQDPSKFRHYGPMAQEFYAAFGNDEIGTIGNDTTISSSDFDGINLVAIQALEKRTRDLETQIRKLENEKLIMQNIIDENSDLYLHYESVLKKIQTIEDKLKNYRYIIVNNE